MSSTPSSDSKYPVLTQLIEQVSDLQGNINADYKNAVALSATSASLEVVSARKGEVDLPTKIGKIDSSLIEKAYDTDVMDRLPAFPQRKDLVFGQEHLAYIQNKVATGVSVNAVFSGDSTVAGYDLADPTDWTLDKAFLRQVKRNGFSNISTFNHGESGMCTEHWNQTYEANDMSANPDLLILRWGINDPSYSREGNLTHLADDGQNFSLRRNAQDFKASLYAGLTKIRASKSYQQLSIILMTPSSTSDDTSFRNSKWHESINAIIREAARTFNCCFIDTYRLFQDSYNANDFMDTMGSNLLCGAAHIHPLDIMNLWITDIIFNTVFSKMFIQEYTSFNKTNALILLNNWVNIGSGLATAGYTKDFNGKVRLFGFIKGGSGTIGNLKLGYRPILGEVFPCAVTGNIVANIGVQSNGDIIFQDSMPATASSGWISLSGIEFYAGF